MRHNDSIIIPHLISFYSTILYDCSIWQVKMYEKSCCENEKNFDEKLLLAVMKNLNTFFYKNYCS